MSVKQEKKRKSIDDFPEDLIKETLDILAETEEFKKGANEVTKSITRTKRGDEKYDPVKLIIIADDVSPPEIIFHLQSLAEEIAVPFVIVPSQDELGEKIGIKRTSCIAVFDGDKFSKVIENATEIVGL